MFAHRHRSLAVLAAGLLAAACAEPPTAAEDIGALSLSKGGKPNSCSAYAPLAITVGDAAGDGVTSDAGGVYQEGVDGVEAHINDPTGNLSIWTTQSPRSLKAHTASGTVNIDRAYTNNHSSTCGLRLSTLPATSSAVFEGEERSGGTGSTISKVLYGVTCGGTADAATRVGIAWDGTTITMTATGGYYCKPGTRKNTWVSAGSVAGFSMTMVVP